jgi:hypothetical protein
MQLVEVKTPQANKGSGNGCSGGDEVATGTNRMT